MKSGFTLTEINPTYAGFTIALIIFLIYCKNHRSQIAFIHVAVIVMTSQAIIGGLSLCYKSLSGSWYNLTSMETTYVFIGALAVIWNAVMSINKLISRQVKTNQ
jgi:hypothetical protein